MDATIRAPTTSPNLTLKPHQSTLMSSLYCCSFRPITRYSKCHSWRVEGPTNGGSLRIKANSEFPKRRWKKESSLTAACSCPLVETCSQRKDKHINGDEKSNLGSTTKMGESTLYNGVDGKGNHAEIVINGLGIKSETYCEVVDFSQSSAGDRIQVSLNGDVLVSHDDGDKSQSLESSTNKQEDFLVVGDDNVSLAVSDDINV